MAKKDKPLLNVAAPGMNEPVETAKEKFINSTKLSKKDSLSISSESDSESDSKIDQKAQENNHMSSDKKENPLVSYGSMSKWMEIWINPYVLNSFESTLRMHYIFLIQCFQVICQALMIPVTKPIDYLMIRAATMHQSYIPNIVKLLEMLLEKADMVKIQEDPSLKPIVDAGIQALTVYRSQRQLSGE